MTDRALAPVPEDASTSVRQALDQLDQGLRAACDALAELRRSLAHLAEEAPARPSLTVSLPGAPPAPPSQAPSETTNVGAPPTSSPERGAGEQRAPAAVAPEHEQRALSAFDRLWDRIEQQRAEKAAAAASEQEARKGLALLPQQYLITVEDRDGRVDLVALHRALQAVDGVKDISLVSYANGVPVVALRSEGEIDLEQLGTAIGSGMDRECEVIPQDHGRVYLRLRRGGRE